MNGMYTFKVHMRRKYFCLLRSDALTLLFKQKVTNPLKSRTTSETPLNIQRTDDSGWGERYTI